MHLTPRASTMRITSVLTKQMAARHAPPNPGAGGRRSNSTAAPAPGPAPVDEVRASPTVRRVAAQCAVDLTTVSGTGIGGRVRVTDVHRVAATNATAIETARGERLYQSLFGPQPDTRQPAAPAAPAATTTSPPATTARDAALYRRLFG